MNFSLKSFLVGAAFCSLALSLPSKGQAEVYYIENSIERFSVSFPDSWKKVNNQKPDDKLTMIGAGHNTFAECRVSINNDRRFVIYPGDFDPEIQRLEVSSEFWDNYLSDFNNVEVEMFKDNAGLGFGHASVSEAFYETSESAIVRKRALMFASLYHDQLYVLECSAEESVYHRWRPTFLSVAKSMNFKKVTHERMQGHYRDFTKEEVEVQGPNQLDVYKF
ncbi:MAG: hypothetical protein ACRBDL_04080 [Alphaproteobacteria bacterium]